MQSRVTVRNSLSFVSVTGQFVGLRLE